MELMLTSLLLTRVRYSGNTCIATQNVLVIYNFDMYLTFKVDVNASIDMEQDAFEVDE
jgi:hypothetical protein